MGRWEVIQRERRKKGKTEGKQHTVAAVWTLCPSFIWRPGEPGRFFSLLPVDCINPSLPCMHEMVSESMAALLAIQTNPQTPIALAGLGARWRCTFVERGGRWAVWVLLCHDPLLLLLDMISGMYSIWTMYWYRALWADKNRRLHIRLLLIGYYICLYVYRWLSFNITTHVVPEIV